MTTKLTQAIAAKLAETSPPGSIFYDDEVSGLRMIVGAKSSSWKLVGRINDAVGALRHRDHRACAGNVAEDCTPQGHRNLAGARPW